MFPARGRPGQGIAGGMGGHMTVRGLFGFCLGLVGFFLLVLLGRLTRPPDFGKDGHAEQGGQRRRWRLATLKSGCGSRVQEGVDGEPGSVSEEEESGIQKVVTGQSLR